MTRYTVTNWDSYLSIPLYVTALTVAASSCNDNNINVIDLSSLKFLRSVVIGNSCFRYVQTFSIVGLNWLESVSIGHESFGSTGDLWERSQLKIVNCPQLKSLRINSGSFGRYNGCELSQLPQLNSIVMGNYYCFRYAGNAVLRGMNDGRDGL